MNSFLPLAYSANVNVYYQLAINRDPDLSALYLNLSGHRPNQNSVLAIYHSGHTQHR